MLSRKECCRRSVVPSYPRAGPIDSGVTIAADPCSGDNPAAIVVSILPTPIRALVAPLILAISPAVVRPVVTPARTPRLYDDLWIGF